MKQYTYKGPGGEVRVREPLAVRLVESTVVLSVLTFIFILWGAYYLHLADQRVFLGRGLSSVHKKLEKDCMACHVPFLGVTDEACQSPECHPKVMADTIHNTRKPRCIECHPEHTGGEVPPPAVTAKTCAECHDRLKADPESQFYPPKWEKRTVTNVPRKIFRHRSHQYPPHYKCWQCHCTGKGTLNTPMEQLFVMDSCLKCHEQENCKVCHPYHQQREPRPRSTNCVRQEYVSELQFKTLECTEYKGRVPGFNHLTVCETGEPAALQSGGAASPAPVAGNTTGPASAGTAAP